MVNLQTWSSEEYCPQVRAHRPIRRNRSRLKLALALIPIWVLNFVCDRRRYLSCFEAARAHPFSSAGAQISRVSQIQQTRQTNRPLPSPQEMTIPPEPGPCPRPAVHFSRQLVWRRALASSWLAQASIPWASKLRPALLKPLQKLIFASHFLWSLRFPEIQQGNPNAHRLLPAQRARERLLQQFLAWPKPAQANRQPSQLPLLPLLAQVPVESRRHRRPRSVQLFE